MIILIEGKGIWKFYSETVVLKNISLCFEPGLVYLILGANGSGKTTLLSLLSGYLGADEGSIMYHYQNGTSSKDIPSAWYLSPGVLYSGFYPELSLEENLSFLGTAYQAFSKEQSHKVSSEIINAEIRRLCTVFRMEEVVHKPVKNLSQGYLQRAFLSRVFFNPENRYQPWVVLDEPSVFLDKDGLDCLVSEIKRVRQGGGTCILSTHDHALLSRLESTLLEIDKGVLSEGRSSI
jgi:ABC-type multidrug transport system ATPase subunit